MLKNRLLLSISAGHFAVDVLTSVVLVLLATLAVPLVLSNAQIGVALTIQLPVRCRNRSLAGWRIASAHDRPRWQAAVLRGWQSAWPPLRFQ